MAIVKMAKFNLSLFSSEKDAILKKLQDFGHVHISQEDTEESGLENANRQAEISRISEKMSRFEEAIKILSPYLPEAKGLKEKYSNAFKERLEKTESEADELIRKMDSRTDEVFSINKMIERSRSQISSYKTDKLEKARWKKLDIPVEDLYTPKSVKVISGVLPARWLDELRKFIAKAEGGLYSEYISGDDKNSYILLFVKDESPELSQLLREMEFREEILSGKGTIREMMEELDKKIMAEEKNIADRKLKLKNICHDYMDDFKEAYEIEALALNLNNKEEMFLKSNYLSFISGYLPYDDLDSFNKIIESGLKEGRYILKLKEADKDDPDVPILLKNNAVLSPFESIVETYSLPLYKEMDPTGLLAPWYIVFFSIMLGDLGYGLILALGSFILLKLFNFKEKTKQSLRFFGILGLGSVVAGIAFGSCLGGLIPMPALIIDPTQDYMIMIVFSVILGFIHLIVGLILQGFQLARESKNIDILYDVCSWIFILVGLAIAGLATVMAPDTIYANVGYALAGLGALLVLFFSARDEKGWGARIAWGTYNLYGSTSYVGDIVSYTRLTAIMLSGAYIGFSFNLIGKMIAGAGILGYLPAVIILIVAHLFNLFLSSLSAYVHSMRLIYVEFFGKFYEGGGRPFKGLRPEAKYMLIKKQEKN